MSAVIAIGVAGFSGRSTKGVRHQNMSSDDVFPLNQSNVRADIKQIMALHPPRHPIFAGKSSCLDRNNISLPKISHSIAILSPSIDVFSIKKSACLRSRHLAWVARRDSPP